LEKESEKTIDTCPYCGAKLVIKNTVTPTPYLVCPDCGFSVEDKTGRNPAPQESSSSCSSCPGCNSG